MGRREAGASEPATKGDIGSARQIVIDLKSAQREVEAARRAAKETRPTP